ncbi:Alpha-N-acetylglucosaminidase [Cordyceps fumosorosea ARSEF 2679]|uniref:Alpha-N-acetylglucosaminidase n=1 Tax=Cordyceps fumosorosea (strain ARSEF 2679) TaxID=1081104 RepID=A0A167LPI1_CORFA|nr:Alpha-N-acetylglucosaminidase [Cordyceps fumosorosea ARSEF 2679]OAA53336.1 Alpha-N-acetylglucosaminidase [Cordyceps fumosorosea ARSEF 2679]
MKWMRILLAAAPTAAAVHEASVAGIQGLARRLFQGRDAQFEFELTREHENWSRWNVPDNDNYTVSSSNGKIRVQGTTLSALARGLRHYANDALKMDEHWFVDTVYKLPDRLPLPEEALTGASTVPWRYNLNTVTFGYTFVWYSWSDWEKLLDWAALRGVNLQLAWVGYERIFLDSFLQLGLAQDDILAFFSGEAFQPWNRFGNIHGTWGPQRRLSLAWIDQQFALQKKIVARMVELGITPVLPGFPGFVPAALKTLRPDADVVDAPAWVDVPANNTATAFLNPTDKTYAELQKLFIANQVEAFGNVTNVYTVDQFNEINPKSGDAKYITDVSASTYAGITAANPAAIWLMQGWLFYSSQGFWTQQRVDAYLAGPPGKNDMVILDLFSESEPQWQRTRSYADRPWIWCQLHDFGGNQALHGKITNVTQNSVQALRESPSLVGYGLTPEGYEGNEVVYDLLLDQAWQASPIDTADYFRTWARNRYAGSGTIPEGVFSAWEQLRQHAYDVRDNVLPSVGVSVYQLFPALEGLANRTGHWPAPTALQYPPNVMKNIWHLFHNASLDAPGLLQVPAFHLDFVDVTRQALGNAFADIYTNLVDEFQAGANATVIRDLGKSMLSFLKDLDTALNTDAHFTLKQWLDSAKSWGESTSAPEDVAFNARSQVTVWSTESRLLDDYAAKAWSGLVRSYYGKRWGIFIDGLVRAREHDVALDEKALGDKIRQFEVSWQYRGYNSETCDKAQDIQQVAKSLMKRWPAAFA